MGRTHYLQKEGMSIVCLSENLKFSDAWDTEVRLGGIEVRLGGIEVRLGGIEVCLGGIH
jgi:hypothetical protein